MYLCTINVQFIYLCGFIYNMLLPYMNPLLLLCKIVLSLLKSKLFVYMCCTTMTYFTSCGHQTNLWKEISMYGCTYACMHICMYVIKAISDSR
jgi:hypothetical protein